MLLNRFRYTKIRGFLQIHGISFALNCLFYDNSDVSRLIVQSLENYAIPESCEIFQHRNKRSLLFFWQLIPLMGFTLYKMGIPIGNLFYILCYKYNSHTRFINNLFVS